MLNTMQKKRHFSMRLWSKYTDPLFISSTIWTRWRRMNGGWSGRYSPIQWWSATPPNFSKPFFVRSVIARFATTFPKPNGSPSFTTYANNKKRPYCRIMKIRFLQSDAVVNAILRWHVATNVDFLSCFHDKSSNKNTEEVRKQKKQKKRWIKKNNCMKKIMALQTQTMNKI